MKLHKVVFIKWYFMKKYHTFYLLKYNGCSLRSAELHITTIKRPEIQQRCFSFDVVLQFFQCPSIYLTTSQGCECKGCGKKHPAVSSQNISLVLLLLGRRSKVSALTSSVSVHAATRFGKTFPISVFTETTEIYKQDSHSCIFSLSQRKMQQMYYIKRN